MDAKPFANLRLGVLLFFDVLYKLAVDFDFDLDFEDFGGTEAQIIEYVSSRQVGRCW